MNLNEPVDFSSHYYPYRRIVNGVVMKGAELIPYKIMRYLLDLPDSAGYMPADDNNRPRVRLMKHLFYDCADPLSQPLPTPEEKLSILFDPEHPDINSDEQKAKHPKGYRMYTQRNVAQSLLEAKTLLKIYPGRILDPTDFRAIIGFQAEIWTSPNLHSNTRTTERDRVFDIECALRDSLDNVDMAGVGCIKFSRNDGSYNGSEVIFAENGMCGRVVYFSTAWMGNT